MENNIILVVLIIIIPNHSLLFAKWTKLIKVIIAIVQTIRNIIFVLFKHPKYQDIN